jgi:hypothetical protein
MFKPHRCFTRDKAFGACDSCYVKNNHGMPVIGLPGVYALKNGGLIRRVDPGGYYSLEEIPQRDNGRGYRVVTIRRPDGSHVTKKVHRLVWQAFNPDHKLTPEEHIDHIDHDKTNNRIDNLRLRDASENSADCRKTSRAGMRVLTAEQKRMVATLAVAGFGTKAIADLAGIGETTVRRLKKQIDEILKNTPEGTTARKELSMGQPRPGEDGYAEFYRKRALRKNKAEPKTCVVCGRAFYRQCFKDSSTCSVSCFETWKNKES